MKIMDLLALGMLIFLLFNAGKAPAQEKPFIVWPVDPLIKVFRDTTAPTAIQPLIRIRCAHNEYEPAQFAITANSNLKDVTVRLSQLKHTSSEYTLSPENLHWNFIGFIPVSHNTWGTPASELIRQAPCLIPDPLLETKSLNIEARTTQPVWLTVFVPPGAPPGEYQGQISVISAQGEEVLNLVLEVLPLTLPTDRHIFVTNWFGVDSMAKFSKVEMWSEQHWQIIGNYARNMAAHRQNVVITPLWLIKILQESNGKLTFDYAQFDRWVELFQKAGAADLIEISHTAHFGEGGWSSKEIILGDITATNRETGKPVRLPPDEGLGPLLSNLQNHLAQRGWLEKAAIHICDEPAEHNLSSWKKASEFVHRHAPLLRRIEAIETEDFGQYLEIWVPKLNHLRNWYEHYKEAQKAGAELWFYTCVHPLGYYPNRFLDFSLIKTRILHWMNWHFGVTGYLHWGLNCWPDNPFGEPNRSLPPGDTHIIYPGENGPLDSMRWEMLREGLEDYEYLWLLTQKIKEVQAKLGPAANQINPKQRSNEITSMLIHSFTDYDKEPAKFNAARDALITELITLEQLPLLLVATDPPAETELIPGPMVIRIFGATEKGAKLTINNRPAELSADGSFSQQLFISPDKEIITIQAELDGAKKTLTRHFPIRKLKM